MRSVAAIIILALPTLGHAGPITAGVGLGLTQAQDGGTSDPNHTISAFGRFGFMPRLAGQFEIQRIQTDNQNLDIRSATGLLVVDLTASGHFVPMLVAGLGVDKSSTSYDDTDGHHLEGGLGFEYRADGGLTVGLDLRMGNRTIDSQPKVFLPATMPAFCTVSGCATASMLHDGDYRSARIAIGVRF